MALTHRTDGLYTAYPSYGSRRVAAQLRREGVGANRKAVQRHMREMGIDIAYIRLQGGRMYLVAVLGTRVRVWHSRYIVAWELDQSLELPFVLRAARRALAGAVPAIRNSDQGSHFTSPQYLGLLEGAAVRISMDGKGRALDNIFTERLWRTVTYEEVYLHSYTSPREARRGLARYLDSYNHGRLHQARAYRTPAEAYHDPHPARPAAAGKE